MISKKEDNTLMVSKYLAGSGQEERYQRKRMMKKEAYDVRFMLAQIASKYLKRCTGKSLKTRPSRSYGCLHTVEGVSIHGDPSQH